MSSFRLDNGFRLQENKEGRQTLETTSEKPFHHVSRDKILHDSWSISAAFPIRHFERGEDPEARLQNTLIYILIIGYPVKNQS